MNKEKYFFIIFLTILACLLAIYVLTNQPSYLNYQDHSFHNVTINKNILRVEVVNSNNSIIQGLSGRPEIGSDGMLFIFKQIYTPTFWMKEMRFDLDFVWIRNNVVVDLTTRVPAPQPGTPLIFLDRYSPQKAVNMVLEIPAGTVEKLQFKIGDKVRFF